MIKKIAFSLILASLVIFVFSACKKNYVEEYYSGTVVGIELCSTRTNGYLVDLKMPDSIGDTMTIGKKFRKLRKDEAYKTLTDEELLEVVKDKTISRPVRIYKGMGLKEYCLTHNLMYEAVYAKFQRFKKDEAYKDSSDEEILDAIIIENRDLNCVYTYKGMSLFKFCKEHKIDYSHIAKAIRKENATTQEEFDKVVDALLERREKRNEKIDNYIYDGVTVKDYCITHDLSLDLIRYKIRALKKDIEFKNESLNIIIDKVLNNETKNKDNKK